MAPSSQELEPPANPGRFNRRHITALEQMLAERLKATFGPDALSLHPEVPGDSTKVYPFSAMVNLKGGTYAVFQAVSPHMASMNSACTKLGDVLRTSPRPTYVEAVVEDIALWQAEDVSLLRAVSTGVSDVETSLNRRLERTMRVN